MTNVRQLISSFAAAEGAARANRFLAPCVGSGQVRTRVDGIVHTFQVCPRDFEGWGVFQICDERTARLIAEAELSQIDAYLRQLAPLRVRLVTRLRGRTWLAYPANESDVRQRYGATRPLAVHLVNPDAGARRFEQIVARTNGGAWWFDDLDRRSAPLDAERLRDAYAARIAPDDLRFRGITPEMRVCYRFTCDQRDQSERHARERDARRSQMHDERRLRDALRFGGGELRDFTDRGDRWIIEWTTDNGERHTSMIAKSDLTVISAGVCLSGEDDYFDLQSLVGVIEKGEWW